MKMPSAMKAKWLKALRSGEYKQGKGVLYNAETAGFCCLGVLQHCLDKGMVEYSELTGHYEYAPSRQWWKSHKVKLRNDIDPRFSVSRDFDVKMLADMNDGYPGKARGKPFKTIANWIEKNIETT